MFLVLDFPYISYLSVLGVFRLDFHMSIENIFKVKYHNDRTKYYSHFMTKALS